MTRAYTFIQDLDQDIDIPKAGMLSRTVFQDDTIKAVAFAFAEGEELSEHTASMPAILHFSPGQADVTLGDDAFTAPAGTWTHLPPNLNHSIKATAPTSLVLLLLKPGSA